MEWKRIKSILLLILLCTNLFLLGNLALQVLRSKDQQRQAMNEALALLRQDVGTFDEEILRQMGSQLPVLSLQRSPEKERQIALALVGSDKQGGGGAVSRYQDASGQRQLDFRSGSAVSYRGPGQVSGNGEEFFLQLLTDAGFPMKGSTVVTQGEQVIFTQMAPQGRVIDNCILTCSQEDGDLLVQGQWILDFSSQQAGEGQRGYQMVMSLRGYLQQQGITAPPTSARVTYHVESRENAALLVYPVWQVEVGKKSLAFSGLDGTPLELEPGGQKTE